MYLSVNCVSLIAYPGYGSFADIIKKKFFFNLLKPHLILEEVREEIEYNSKTRICDIYT